VKRETWSVERGRKKIPIPHLRGEVGSKNYEGGPNPLLSQNPKFQIPPPPISSPSLWEGEE